MVPTLLLVCLVASSGTQAQKAHNTLDTFTDDTDLAGGAAGSGDSSLLLNSYDNYHNNNNPSSSDRRNNNNNHNYLYGGSGRVGGGANAGAGRAQQHNISANFDDFYSRGAAGGSTGSNSNSYDYYDSYDDYGTNTAGGNGSSSGGTAATSYDDEDYIDAGSGDEFGAYDDYYTDTAPPAATDTAAAGSGGSGFDTTATPTTTTTTTTTTSTVAPPTNILEANGIYAASDTDPTADAGATSGAGDYNYDEYGNEEYPDEYYDEEYYDTPLYDGNDTATVYADNHLPSSTVEKTAPTDTTTTTTASPTTASTTTTTTTTSVPFGIKYHDVDATTPPDTTLDPVEGSGGFGYDDEDLALSNNHDDVNYMDPDYDYYDSAIGAGQPDTTRESEDPITFDSRPTVDEPVTRVDNEIRQPSEKETPHTRDDYFYGEEELETEVDIKLDVDGGRVIHEEDILVVREEAGPGGSMDGSVQIVTHKEDDRQVSIFAQPGMLAAFIGGAVVGLLCAILLVMFVVYRMRKKDEGSYPLDEPKRLPLTSSYATTDKEIYA